ncbi:MAG: cyclase, partial [Proteobacteria bacterium]
MAINPQEVKSNLDRTQILKARTESRGQAYNDDVSHFAITIGRPPEEVFAFWRDFKNLPTFMKDLKDIKILSDKKSHWMVELESGIKAEWDAEITAERAGEMISWK